jgi:lipid A 3-O-deacylase
MQRPHVMLHSKRGDLTVSRIVSRTLLGGLTMLGITFVHPAAAQVTFGSPTDPPRVALGGGAFDVLPDKKKPGNGAAGLVLSEYRFGDVLWIVAPFVGVMGTGKGAFYGYGGFGFDINFFDKWVVTPTATVGYFSHGTGIDLGAHCEFRTGAEFDYRFDNLTRIGVGLYHLSNAGIGKQNPGVELATFVLTVPLH